MSLVRSKSSTWPTMTPFRGLALAAAALIQHASAPSFLPKFTVKAKPHFPWRIDFGDSSCWNYGPLDPSVPLMYKVRFWITLQDLAERPLACERCEEAMKGWRQLCKTKDAAPACCRSVHLFGVRLASWQHPCTLAR